MKFGPLPIGDALGAILVHGQTLGGRRYRKGHVIDRDDVEALTRAGISEIAAALLEDGDVGENAAARELAEASRGTGVRTGTEGTGRVNIFAERDGLVHIDAEAVNRVNAIDEGITIATLHPLDRVEAGQIVATVKIIPFAVPRHALSAAVAAATAADGLVSVAPYARRRIGLLQTRLPGLQAKVTAKTESVARARVEALGSDFAGSRIVDHDLRAVTHALEAMIGDGVELVLIIGASATVDRRDAIPAAIEAAGGTIEHFGMPVDPGNLLVLARIGAVPVLALPGSARSPRIGGNDLVLERILAGVPVDGAHIMGMGVGGLLKEIPSRPLPRAAAAPREESAATAEESRPRIAAVILGGGQSRRMGSVNKLLIEVDGLPMIRHAVDAARAAGADPVIVVTGHQAEAVGEAAGDDAICAFNPDHAEGLSTSLRTGISAVPKDCDGAIVALGDMPRVGPVHFERLMAAFDPASGHDICVPTWDGKRGNPVLWGRRHFDAMCRLDGDVGAKHLIAAHIDAVVEVPMYDSGVLLDVDSPAALAALTGSDRE